MNLMKMAWKVYKEQQLKKEKLSGFTFSFYNRQTVVFVLTSRCNFNCRHCLREDTQVKDLPFEIARAVVEEAKKYHFRHLSFTGGEPLLYPHFKELIELTVQKGYVFNFATNGWLFSDFLPLFSKYHNRITEIVFSVESHNRDKNDFMRKQGCFDKLLDNFDACRRNKIPFSILTVISPLNYEEIIDIGQFARRQKAKALIFATMLPCSRTHKNKLILDAKKRQELFVVLKDFSKIIKMPVFMTGSIRANSNIVMCNSVAMRDIAVDYEGNIIRCCDLAGHKEAEICSLKDKSFEEALKLWAEDSRRFISRRIEEYKGKSNIEDIDFNSCFYCMYKLGK